MYQTAGDTASFCMHYGFSLNPRFVVGIDPEMWLVLMDVFRAMVVEITLT
jgi:hypothetical protein